MKILLQSLRKNKVVKNAGWIIGGKVSNKLLAFVVGIFAARYLGPSNYGLINYAAAYAAFFASLCTLGINSVIVKNFVDHPDQQGETIGTTLLLRAISSLLSALSIIGIVSVVDRGERLTVVVVALYSIGLIFRCLILSTTGFRPGSSPSIPPLPNSSRMRQCLCTKLFACAWEKRGMVRRCKRIGLHRTCGVLLIAYFKNGGTRFRYSLEKQRSFCKAAAALS